MAEELRVERMSGGKTKQSITTDKKENSTVQMCFQQPESQFLHLLWKNTTQIQLSLMI